MKYEPIEVYAITNFYVLDVVTDCGTSLLDQHICELSRLK